MSNPIPGDDAVLPPLPKKTAIGVEFGGAAFAYGHDDESMRRFGLGCIAIGRGNAVRDYVAFGAPVSADAAADLEFNAQRLRNVAHQVGLQGAIPDSDATLDGSRGAVLGMIADRLRREMKWDADRAAGAPAETVKAVGEVKESSGENDTYVALFKPLPIGTKLYATPSPSAEVARDALPGLEQAAEIADQIVSDLEDDAAESHGAWRVADAIRTAMKLQAPAKEGGL